MGLRGFGEHSEYSERVGAQIGKVANEMAPDELRLFKQSAGVENRDRWRRILGGRKLSHACVDAILTFLAERPQFADDARKIESAWDRHSELVRRQRPGASLARQGVLPERSESSRPAISIAGPVTAAIGQRDTQQWRTTSASLVPLNENERRLELVESPATHPDDAIFPDCRIVLELLSVKAAPPMYEVRIDNYDNSGAGRGIIHDLGDALRGYIAVGATSLRKETMLTMILIREGAALEPQLRFRNQVAPQTVHHVPDLFAQTTELTPMLRSENSQRWLR